LKFVIDTHNHTIASDHAYSTVQELAREAADKGIKMFAVTDHGPSLKGSSSEIHFWNLKEIPEFIYGVRVLRGVEANILDYSGKLDLHETILKRLDFVIASFHDIVIEPSTVEEHTRALEAVLANPYVDAIGHPGNPVFQVDIERVVKTAKKYGKFIEINNHSFSVRQGCEENCMNFALKCKEHGTKIVCGSDSHISFDLGKLDRVAAILEAAEVPEELLMCTDVDKFEAYLEEKKSRIRVTDL